MAVGGGAGTAVAGLVGVAEGTGAAAGAGSGPQPARTSSRIQRDNNVRSLFFMRIFSPVALTAILSVIEPSGLYRSCCILGNCLLCCLRAEGWWDTSTGGSANSLAEAAPRCLSSYSVAFPCHWPLKRARVVLRALAPCRSAATAHRGESPSRRRARSATQSCRLHGSAPAYEQRSRRTPGRYLRCNNGDQPVRQPVASYRSGRRSRSQDREGRSSRG